MEDGTYKTSIVKKRMLFLALRKNRCKTIGAAVRGVRKALKEAERLVARQTGERAQSSNEIARYIVRQDSAGHPQRPK